MLVEYSSRFYPSLCFRICLQGHPLCSARTLFLSPFLFCSLHSLIFCFCFYSIFCVVLLRGINYFIYKNASKVVGDKNQLEHFRQLKRLTYSLPYSYKKRVALISQNDRIMEYITAESFVVFPTPQSLFNSFQVSLNKSVAIGHHHGHANRQHLD